MDTNNDCFTCNKMKKKQKSSVMCTGCQKRFCKEHHQEHRKTIEKDFEGLIEQHNILRQNLYVENNNENGRTSKLLKKIDDWEKEMIQNIKTTAATTRTRITEVINQEKNQLKQNFKSMADELKTNASTSDYIETDIQEWQRQLSECKQKLEQLQTSNNDFIDIDIKSLDWKNSINIHQRKDVQLNTKRPLPNGRSKTRQEQYNCCLYCENRFHESAGYNRDFCSLDCSNNYYDNENVCFHGNCVVSLANGLTKLVKDIRKGDVLRTPDGSEATIIYVIKILCKNKRASMVSFNNGLIITPWHPIRIKGKWTFPRDIADEKVTECEAVYSFALDVGHIITIGGIECVTLGHDFKGDVIEHPYYGTTKVLDDLRAIDYTKSGFIELLPNSVVRDIKTGLVSGIRRYSKTSLSEQLYNLNTGL